MKKKELGGCKNNLGNSENWSDNFKESFIFSKASKSFHCVSIILIFYKGKS